MTALRISLLPTLAGIAYGWLWVNNLPLLRELVVALALAAVVIRFVLWPFARFLAASPPMTDHLRDEASVLLNRSER